MANKGIELEGLGPLDLEKIDKKTLNNVANNFRNQMSAPVKAEYTKLKSDEERKQWLSHYIIDPETAVHQGYNKVEVVNSKMDKNKVAWLTESQLGGPMYLNDVGHAKILVDAKSFREQEHETPALAAAGVKQYEFSWAILEKSTGVVRTAGVSSTSELTASEAVAIGNDMEAKMGEPVANTQKVEKQKKEPTAEEKALKQTKTVRTTMLRKLKQKIDKTNIECDNHVLTGEALTGKGYPADTAVFLNTKIAILRKAAEDAQAKYGVEVQKSDSLDLEECEASADAADKALADLDAANKEFLDGPGGGIIKLQ